MPRAGHAAKKQAPVAKARPPAAAVREPVAAYGDTRHASHVVSLADAKRDFSELCARASYGRDTIVVTKHGRPLVAIIGMAELERCQALEDQRALEVLTRAVATSKGTARARLRP